MYHIDYVDGAVCGAETSLVVRKSYNEQLQNNHSVTLPPPSPQMPEKNAG